MSKIGIIGTGYVGLVSGVCLADMGNSVICIDNNKEKLEVLSTGKTPFYEPGLDSLLSYNHRSGRLAFASSIAEVIDDIKILFICVGTPEGNNGETDLSYVKAVAEEIGRSMNSYKIIITKSTVPVGTTYIVKEIIKRELEKRNADVSFDVANVPEFLKEGSAVADFMRPDRIVIGYDNPKVFSTLRQLFSPFKMQNIEMILGMDIRSSEMTKYTANALLATKISFINEISRICETVGADVNQVRLGVGSDSRIGYKFLYPGIGFGGSCFPKDVKSIVSVARSNGVEPKLLSSVLAVNEEQRTFFVDKVFKHFGQNLKGLHFGIWGLTFKPETDDVRETPALDIVVALIKAGATILAYDPMGEKNFVTYLKDKGHSDVIEKIEFVWNKYDAVNNVDGLLLLTEWKEFRSPDFDELSKRMRSGVVFDGRNQYNKSSLTDLGLVCYQIGN